MTEREENVHACARDRETERETRREGESERKRHTWWQRERQAVCGREKSQDHNKTALLRITSWHIPFHACNMFVCVCVCGCVNMRVNMCV